MINENIRQLRRDAGMTQEQLAEQLGVTRQTISKWENGSSVPDADVVSKMASLLDVPVNELLGCASDKNITSNDCAKILAMMNEEQAAKNHFRKSVIRIVRIVLIVLAAGMAALLVYTLFWMWIAATM